jgi:hypothetical protein
VSKEKKKSDFEVNCQSWYQSFASVITKSKASLQQTVQIWTDTTHSSNSLEMKGECLLREKKMSPKMQK